MAERETVKPLTNPDSAFPRTLAVLDRLYSHERYAKYKPLAELLEELLEPGEHYVEFMRINRGEHHTDAPTYRAEVSREDRKAQGTGITPWDALHMARAKVEQAIKERNEEYAKTGGAPAKKEKK